MKTKVLFSLLFLTVILWSCQQEDDVQTLALADNCPNCINFENLQVGQQSRYVAFKGKRDFEEQAWHYESDTLVVNVVAQENTHFIFEEFLTTNPDSIRKYTVALSADSVKINLSEYWVGSWLFQGGQHIAIALAPTNQQFAEIKGWEAIVDCNLAPCYGFLSEYKQNRVVFNNLYVYHNYGPMAWDGNGYFAIYNQKYGVVRSVSVGSWVPVGKGWDLIME